MRVFLIIASLVSLLEGAVFSKNDDGSMNFKSEGTEDVYKRESMRIPQQDLMRFFIDYFDGNSPSYAFI
ncbi:Oidioi.mRNA.OKI2018_I69.chr1.g576.t1.cds [Oikopleura dioica]|uniref:Oidioi.mRNA.OKI2018_I69.chr1.g576.t1.cds n=1 Tax=Oikopleura dioica TaxID=34765 RepID=A0ABN7SQA8_OIKDI|nr:Oidioi.mRNA.OKI2018_I69.chr1.g576.t1.cds [Oikopleura dioica]